MAVERYARSAYEDKELGVECTVAVEFRDGDDVDLLTHNVQDMARDALFFGGGNHKQVCAFAESVIQHYYPDRAYFIETDEDGRGVQVYDPKDFVKERCRCNEIHTS